MELLMIALSLILLITLAYRGFSVILIAPLLAMFAAAVSDMSTMPVYGELFMTKAAEFIKLYYPIFLLGAVFARLMEQSGMVASLASLVANKLGKERAILAVLIGGGIMTYGGINVFVGVFVMYPVAAVLFRGAGVPKRLMPAALWMGIFTYAMVALPGTPQIQNIIPAAFFGTSTWAAPVTSILSAAVYFVIAWGWLTYRYKKLKAQGEDYGDYTLNEPDPIDVSSLPSWKISVIPFLVVLGLNLFLSNPFQWAWAYHWQVSLLEPLKHLKLSLLSPSVEKAQAIWSLEIALGFGSVAALIFGRKRLKIQGFVKQLNAGAMSSLAAVMNTASVVAFGSVITSLASFQIIKDALLNLHIGSGPLFSEVITTNVMIVLSGSASGGMTIALGMLGNEWANWAAQIGMSPDILHRIVCLASAGLDTLPHNGALLTLVGVCGLTYRESYADIAVLTLFKVLVAFVFIAWYGITGIA